MSKTQNLDFDQNVNIVDTLNDIYLNKYQILSFLIKLKTNVEFNTSDIDWKKIAKVIGHKYNDNSPYYNKQYYTPNDLTPEYFKNKNNIFVFGSNTEGRHGKGAAKFAIDYCGAIYGQSKGLQGQSYGIITKNLSIKENNSLRSVSLEFIEQQIDEFLEFANNNKELTFFVTKIGSKLAGFTMKEIADLFNNKLIPHNVYLPIEYAKPYLCMEYFYCKENNSYYNLKQDTNQLVEVIFNENDNECSITNYSNADLFLKNHINFKMIESTKEEFISISKKVINKLY
jgi:hypothetical protein